jgi:hypothetical protein
MAKKTPTTDAAASTAAPTVTPTETAKTASKATQKLIDAVREPFVAYTQQYVALGQTRSKLAPPFMKAYNSWAGETGGSFVAFVRLFDATVGLKSDEYRNHSTYQAAEYLRRRARDIAAAQEVAAAEAAGELPVGAAGVGADAPATPMDALARFVAMVLPLIAHEDQPKVWQFFTTEYNWSERRVSALREMVEAAKPFATVRTEKGQPRPQLHLIHTRVDSKAKSA